MAALSNAGAVVLGRIGDHVDRSTRPRVTIEHTSIGKKLEATNGVLH